MRINDILIESDRLQEGPILNKIGSGLGKAVGNAGKAIGAVAGGVAGAVDAAKKGFTAGRSAVAGAGDKAPTSAADINVQGSKGTATDNTQPDPGTQASQKTDQAADNAGADAAAVKKELNDFLATYRKDLAMQNKNWEFVTPKVNALEKQVADLVASGNAAPTAKPETKRRGGKVAGELSTTPDAVRKRNSRRDKKNATATTGGAGAFNQMTQQVTQQNASKNNLGNPLAEALDKQIKVHKQNMFEQTLSADSYSIFRKK